MRILRTLVGHRTFGHVPRAEEGPFAVEGELLKEEESTKIMKYRKYLNKATSLEDSPPFEKVEKYNS